MRGEASIFVSPDVSSFRRFSLDAAKSPSLIIVKDGGSERVHYKDTLELNTDFARSDLRKWIMDNKYPLVPLLDAHNSEHILGNDNLVVLGIFDTQSVETKHHVALLRLAAREFNRNFEKTALEGQRNQVVFAWIDARDKSDYVKRVYGLNLQQLPRVIIAEPRLDQFYDSEKSGRLFALEKDSILSHVNDALSGVLKPKSTHGYFGATLRKIIHSLSPFFVRIIIFKPSVLNN